jgi:hypothetical protein
MGRTARVPTICQPGLQTLVQWFIVCGMGEKNCLHRESLNVGCIALSHFGCVRPHHEQSAETATSNARCSHLSGEVRCGGGWDFRKPALNKGRCQLKPILWI